MKRVGIIGAMESEVEHLKSRVVGGDTYTVSGVEFRHGKLGDVHVIVARSGVGKVNAAICAQTMAVRYGVGYIINTGVAGSTSDDAGIGDIVVATDAVQHDVDATNFGYELGEVPQIGVKSFESDERLRSMAVSIAMTNSEGRRVIEGRVASGDTFVRDASCRDWISTTFGAVCCEMEGAAIAQVAHVNGIPFAIVRVISDNADGMGAESYQEFEDAAALACSRIVEGIVSEMRRKP